MLASLALALSVAHGVAASPAAVVPRQEATPTSLSVTAATPSPTAALDSKLPSQAPLPPAQKWCPSEIFCAGALLQTVNIARPFGDSKTIVDKPTSKSPEDTLAQYNAFGNDTQDITYQEVVTFLQSAFQPEGLELQALSAEGFNSDPKFLDDIDNKLVKGFSRAVHGYWQDLIRGTNESRLCDGKDCESSLIPLNHTFVVPGGRFREIYYWDSFFVEQGLLVSGLHDAVNSTLQNFMDQLDLFGFIPNGGRIYYLNRSQPPFFIPMLHQYVNVTGDTDILTRALPLAEAELKWWATNRGVSVDSPFSNSTRNVYHYAVDNSAPRPESYYEDYNVANGDDLKTPYSDQDKALLYSNLASGAESGWDYSSRWFKDPLATNSTIQLRSLNTREIIPVDLNSILYKAHIDLADLYSQRDNNDDADRHRDAAASLRTAIIDLFWDADKFAFYDYNMTGNARANHLTAAHFYPLAFGIHPKELLADSGSAFKAFASVNLVMARYNGTYPATWVSTGQQWDAPNAWPPHQYLVLEALHNLPSNVSSGALPTPAEGKNSLSLIPAGQLGTDDADLPVQILAGGAKASQEDISVVNGTVVNGGNPSDGEGWAAALERQLANRYFASALCSWHATGGELSDGVLDRLPDDQLNVTASVGQKGHMYEKYSLVDMDSAGRGGEYTVQAGFGWSNGVLLYVADRYSNVLQTPNCPEVLAVEDGAGGSGGSGGNGGSDGAASLKASATMVAVFMAAVAAFVF